MLARSVVCPDDDDTDGIQIIKVDTKTEQKLEIAIAMHHTARILVDSIDDSE